MNSPRVNQSKIIRSTTIFSTIVVFFILDRFLKSAAADGLLSSIDVIKNIFQINFIPNYNISFSLPLSGAWLKIVLAAVVIGIMVYATAIKTHRREPDIYFWWLMIVGATSNLLDRWRWGYVVDYFDVTFFTVFNVADIMISIGALGLIWINWRALRRQK